MNKIIEGIKEHPVLSIMGTIAILAGIIIIVINTIEGLNKYESGLNNNEEIPFVPKSYGVNEYKIINVEEADMVLLYYKDFIKKYTGDINEAWNILNIEYKKNMFKNDIEKFKIYLKNHSSIKTKNNKVVSYKYDYGATYNTIKIIDSENYIYTFYEYGMWKYDVVLEGQID